MGSPHTSSGMAWALGLFTEALTAGSASEQAEGLRTLLKLQCGDGLMHESVHVDNLQQCTRKWFEVGWVNVWVLGQGNGCRAGCSCPALGLALLQSLQLCHTHTLPPTASTRALSPTSAVLQWANAMLVVSVEQLLGIDCDDAAQAYHLARVKVRGRVLLWRGWACTGSLHFIIPDATALYVLSADCLTSCCLPAHLAGLLAACLPACLPTWLPARLPACPPPLPLCRTARTRMAAR